MAQAFIGASVLLPAASVSTVSIVGFPPSGSSAGDATRRLRLRRVSPANCQRLIHNLLDGAGTSAALPGVAQASINLTYAPRPNRTRQGAPDLNLTEHVAGADDHQSSPK
jgi:hypothetical protein